MNITLEDIKAAQSKVSAMIESFEITQKIASSFPISVKFPDLNAGEKYVGTIITADGTKREHIILLPGEAEPASQQAQMKWAASIGGELPDRVEGALLFATMKDEFKTEWHWTREQYANGPGYAWMQGFDYGNHYNNHKSYEYRARAVRRELIIE